MLFIQEKQTKKTPGTIIKGILYLRAVLSYHVMETHCRWSHLILVSISLVYPERLFMHREHSQSDNASDQTGVRYKEKNIKWRGE